MFFQFNKRKASSDTKDYEYAALLSFRKRIPNSFSLFFLLISCKYMPLVLIGCAFTNLDNPSSSLWKILNYLTFFQQCKPIMNIPYHAVCACVYVLLLTFFGVEMYLKLHIKFFAKSIDVYAYRRDNSMIKLPMSYKRVQRLCIAMYCVLVLFSQHISEVLFYGVFDVIGMFNDMHNVNKHKQRMELLMAYHKRHAIDKYFLFSLNLISLMYMVYIIFKFFGVFCKQHFKESYGFGMHFTLFSKLYIVIVSNMQALYTVSFIYTAEAQKQFLFYISCVILFLNVTFIVNVILLRKTFLERAEFVNFVLVNMCCVSMLYDMSAYLLMRGAFKLHLINALPRIIISLLNGIFISKLVKYFNERSLQLTIQKHFFNYHQDNFYSEINKYVRAFLYLSKLLPATNDPLNRLHDTLRQVARRHTLTCENKNCLCKTLSQHSDRSLISGYHMIFRNVLHSLLRLMKKLQYTKKRYYQLLYINEVDFEHLVMGNNIKALYLSQLYMEATHVVSEPYQFYEMRKIINRSYKLKHIKVEDETMRNYLRETVKKIQEIFSEEANNEKIQKLMYDICSGFEDVFRLKAIIASKHKVDITSDELLVILEKLLLTQRMLINSVNEYFITKHTHSNEIKYLLTQFNTTIPFSSGKAAVVNATSTTATFINNSNDVLQKDDECYLLFYINSHNAILVKSMSLKLLDVLKYTKREMCDTELSKLLPAFIGELHNTAIVEEVTKTKHLSDVYTKIAFMLTKKRELIRIHFAATIFPSFEKDIYVINKVTKLDLVDAERNYQYYYMLTDENYNVVTMSPEFACDFSLNYKMLKRYQINLPHLFSLNQDKLFKYFNTKKQNDDNNNANNSDTNTCVINTGIINGVTTINSANTLETKTFTQMQQPKVKQKFQSMYECVHKDVMALMLKKVLKKHQEHGVSQEEQKRLQTVINKLQQQQQKQNEQITSHAKKNPSLLFSRSPQLRKLSKDISNNDNAVATCTNNNNNNNNNNKEYIYLKLERRFIESQCYFIVRIRTCKTLLDHKRRATHNLLQLDSLSKTSVIRNAGTYIGGNGYTSKNALFGKSKINVDTTASPGSRASKRAKGGVGMYCDSQIAVMVGGNGKLQTIVDENEEDDNTMRMQYKGIELLTKKNHSAMICSDFYHYGKHSNNNGGVSGGKDTTASSTAVTSKKRLIMRKPTFTTKMNDAVYQQQQQRRLSEIASLNNASSTSIANDSSVVDATTTVNDNNNNKTKSSSSSSSLPSKTTTQIELIVLKHLNKQFKHHIKTTSYIKIFQSGLYILLAILCIVSFTSNKNNLNNSLSIFHLNSYAFMVSLDIFYCSLICLRGCFINDKLHIANETIYEFMKQQSQNQLIHHYHKFMQLVNSLVMKRKGGEIFDILNAEATYYRLMADWEEKETRSNFLDEIRQIYYYTSHFNLTNKDNACRIQQVFINRAGDALKRASQPSEEEKFVYYICRNIMNQLSTHLDMLTTQTTKYVKIFSSQSRWNSLTINAGIVVVALVIYFTVIVMVRMENKFFYNYLITIFQQKENEGTFMHRLVRLKYLIYNFSFEECRKYEMNNAMMMYNGGNGGVYNNKREHVSGSNNNNNSVQVSPVHKRKRVSKNYNYYAGDNSAYTKSTSISDVTNNNTSMNALLNTSQVINSSVNSFITNTNTNNGSNNTNSNSNSNNTSSNSLLTSSTTTNINKLILQFPEPSVTKKVNIIVIILFILFIILQIINFSYSISFFNDLFMRNQISMSFCSQIPKLSEFFLYAVISIMLNSPFYIQKNASDYASISASNVIDTTYDYTKDSMYTLIGNSNYYYLYYQLTLYRLNIDHFLSTSTVNGLFKRTGEVETEFLEFNGDFCIHLQLFYYAYSIRHTVETEQYALQNDLFDVTDVNELFRSVSNFARICRSINNGINKSGVRKAVDVHLNQINVLYMEFLSAEDKYEEIKNVLMDSNMNGLFDNLFFVLKKFHFVTNDIVSYDIEQVLHEKYDTDILFSVSSIIFSFGIVLVIIFVIASKIEKFTNITMHAANLFDCALNNCIH